MQDFTENSEKGNSVTYSSRSKTITANQGFLVTVIFWLLHRLKTNMDLDKIIHKFHTHTQS